MSKWIIEVDSTDCPYKVGENACSDYDNQEKNCRCDIKNCPRFLKVAKPAPEAESG